jgi:hypothetical protein
MTVRVYRGGGAASSSASQHIDDAAIGIEHDQPFLMFLDQRGFGDSHYTLRIELENFRHLIEAMLLVNADETIKAVANALKDGIPAPAPKGDSRVIVYRTKPSEAA